MSWAWSQSSLRNAMLSLMRRNVVGELARRSPEYLTPFVFLRISALLGGAVSVRNDESGPWLFPVAHDATTSVCASASVAAIIASTVAFGLSSEPGHWITSPHALPTSAAFLRCMIGVISMHRRLFAACRRIAASVILACWSVPFTGHLFC